jgi:dGTPase
MSIADRWPRLLSPRRIGDQRSDPGDGRPAFDRDFDRILFSTPFRRLHGKTQVVVRPGDDHVHTRLVHSLETASVGRSLGQQVGRLLVQRHGRKLKGFEPGDLGAVVSAACLMHDLGNPPFGHAGEEAIGSWFQARVAADPILAAALAPGERRDLERFEGNAQGFRIATRLTMYRGEGGMRLTAAVLAAAAKYPQPSTAAGELGRLKKHGYHGDDFPAFAAVAEACAMTATGPGCWARHPAAWLVEAADDICYQVLDLEDAWRLGQVTFAEARKLLLPLCGGRDSGLRDEVDRLGELRARSIGHLIQAAVTAFLEHEDALVAGDQGPALVLRTPLAAPFRRLARFAAARLYQHRDKQRAEVGGMSVIAGLLDRVVPAVLAARPDPVQRRIRAVLDLAEPGGTPYRRLLAVCDRIAGMTDRHAVQTLDQFNAPR